MKRLVGFLPFCFLPWSLATARFLLHFSMFVVVLTPVVHKMLCGLFLKIVFGFFWASLEANFFGPKFYLVSGYFEET